MIKECIDWLRINGRLFVLMLAVSLIALIPIYGILVPPLADLPQQILVNKLLWEKLTGSSHLDIEISRYLGYRLPSAVIVGAIAVCRSLGISPEFLPNLVAAVLISLHSIIISTLLYFGLEDRTWKSLGSAVFF